MIERRVLVSGATGNQGGSVVQALIKDGHHVIGLTRNAASPKAIKLNEQGVELISADFTDMGALVKVMQTVDTVLSMTTPFEGGWDVEIEQGKSMANAALKAGVGHFIFNSVGDANQPTGIPHFDSKFEVEKHLETLQIPYTIIGPAFFMENMFFPYILDPLKQGVLKMAMPGDRKLQQISVEDIGRFVNTVVNERENMFGKRINISGDEISGNDAAEVLSGILGREVVYEGYSLEILKEWSEDMAMMFRWFIDKGYTADLKALQKYRMKSFKDWALKQDWSALN